MHKPTKTKQKVNEKLKRNGKTYQTKTVKRKMKSQANNTSALGRKREKKTKRDV